jgi:SAM-dependent methyltransferase
MVATREAFQPVAVRASSRWRFALRCAVDLQLLTIERFLAPRLARLRGRVLDAGAGEGPWRERLQDADYVGLDVDDAASFGMSRDSRIVYYDGRTMPFEAASFDHALSVEVLEHVRDPALFIGELARVVRPGGTLLMTVPWSARLHHLPHDYQRFTRFGLERLLADGGFVDVVVVERGNDVAVIANKLTVAMVVLARTTDASLAWRWPLALLLAPLAAGFVVAAHVALAAGLGSRLDPLGYAVTAVRP